MPGDMSYSYCSMGNTECQEAVAAHEDPAGASLLSVPEVLGLEYVGKETSAA